MTDREDIRREGQEQRVKGSIDELKGKVRGDVGDALDDKSEHAKGRAQELKGKVQKKVGEAMEKGARDDDKV